MNNMKFAGRFSHYILRNGVLVGDVQYDDNLVVDEGINYIMGTALSSDAAKSAFYVGLFGNNYTPVAADIQASGTATNNFCNAAKAGEVTAVYDETTRPAWQEAGVSAKVITNAANKATFTFNASDDIYGAFLTGGTGSDVKAASGSGHVLVAAAKFSTVRSVINGDILVVTYQITGSAY
jgi:hypothetical protein